MWPSLYDMGILSETDLDASDVLRHTDGARDSMAGHLGGRRRLVLLAGTTDVRDDAFFALYRLGRPG